MLKGKYISLSAFIKKEERSQINNLSFSLTKLVRKNKKFKYEGNNEDERGKTKEKKTIKET